VTRAGAGEGHDEPDELGGDDGDDAGLRSMRAVWISMRDEEPPSGGLAELLAAARVKADEMRPREPWWQRALAALRRPPVLALATVVVLVSGALVISGRREKFEVVPELEADRGAGAGAPARERAGTSPAAGSGAAAEAPTGQAAQSAPDRSGNEVALGGGADEKNMVAPAKPKLSGEPSPTEAPAVAGGPVVPAVPVAPPAGNRRTIAGGGEGGGAPATGTLDSSVKLRDTSDAKDVKVTGRDLTRGEGAGEGEQTAVAEPAPESFAPPPPQTAPQSTATVKKGQRAPTKQDLQIANDADSGAAAEAPAPAGATAAGTGRTQSQSQSQGQRGPTASQLAKQSETAAARGDCAAVRAIVVRLRKLDAELHKEHVERNAAVRRCLK
jgi:hypothetical protein